MIIKKFISNKIVIIFAIIFLQLLVVAFLTNKIIDKQRSILGTYSVNTISSQNIVVDQDTGLKYFYEPKADHVELAMPTWLGYIAKYTINKDALNERRNYEVKKPENTFRIITLGDSFTFGQFINTEDNYPETLEDKLNELQCKKKIKFEVINLGVYGYDIRYSLERYRKRGVKYDPDLVLWMINGGNVLQLAEIMHPIADNMDPLLKASGEYNRLLNKGIYYPAWEKAREEMINQLGKERILSLQKGYLEDFNKIFNKDTVAFGFFNQEIEGRIIEDFAKSSNKVHYFKNLTNIYAIKDGVLPDSHPSKLGDEIIATDVLEYLKNNNLIPCN